MEKIFAFLFLIAFLLVAWLPEFDPGDGRFYVKHVEEGATTTKYHLVQVGGSGKAWVTAERGLYHVGDTVSIQPVKP